MKLRIFLPETGSPETSPRLAWMLFDARGELLRREESPLLEMPRANEVEAVLPAARVLFARLKLPRVNAATIRELLPFAVEDRLLADPAHIHAVAGHTNARGETIVAVVDRDALQSAVDALTHAGLRPRRAWCESALLAGGQRDWHVVVGSAHGFLVDDDGVAVAFDRSGASLPLAVRATLDEAAGRGERPDAVRVHASGGAPLPDIASWSEQAGLPFTAGGQWESIAAGATPRGAIDLLQGDFSTRERTFSTARISRPALGLAAAIALLQLTFTAVDFLRLRSQQRDLAARQEAVFRESFPQAQAVVDPPLQMARNLAELKRSRGLAAEDDFLTQATRAAREFPDGSARSLAYANGKLEIGRGEAAQAPKP